METFKIYDNPREAYKFMLEDILHAKKYIFLETYIYNNDKIGRKFLKVLKKKAKEGVKIKLLLDAWGGTAKKPFFESLIKAGAEVRFFRELQYFIRIFSKNHERNHRKLLLIDNKITYIGSMNITAGCLDWRELVLRMEDGITHEFAKSFFQSWEMFGKLNKRRIEKIIHDEFEIIQDIPMYYQRATENRLYRLFSKAKKKISIETPFFVPSNKLINTLGKAVKRGVEVILLIPYHSGVRTVDIVRNGYLGKMYKKGVFIHYYRKNLHSKLLIIDNSFFMLGSSNIDYRSFNHNYEINFIGKDKRIIKELNCFFMKGILHSEIFNYKEWKKRSSFWKTMELFLELIKRYL